MSSCAASASQMPPSLTVVEHGPRRRARRLEPHVHEGLRRVRHGIPTELDVLLAHEHVAQRVAQGVVLSSKNVRARVVASSSASPTIFKAGCSLGPALRLEVGHLPRRVAAPLGSLQLWCSPCCGLSAGRNALERSRYIFGCLCGCNGDALCFLRPAEASAAALQLLVSYVPLAPLASGGGFCKF